MKIKILTICMTLIFMLAGCRGAIYFAIGPQELDNMELRIGKQRADPNEIPPEMLVAWLAAMAGS